jgi:hypothetical protein
MPILDSEILWRPATLMSDTTPAQNGGRMASSQLISGVKNNLFPDVSQAERLAGSVKWRKAFIHVASSQDVALMNVRVFLDAQTPANDFVTFAIGTPTDTEDQLASARPYGIGTLNSALTAGSTELQLLCENHASYTALQPFRVDDLIRVADRPSIGGTGNEEWVSISAITYGADFATVTVAPALANAYATANTLVSSVRIVSQIVASWDTFSKTSTAGNVDNATLGNLVAHNKGAIAETWTLTFTSATAFTVSGLSVGALAGTGTLAADFAPLNPATGTPYFTIRALAWSGTWATNNQISFKTHPAALPVWYRREVPAGTVSLANDYASLAIHGESA